MTLPKGPAALPVDAVVVASFGGPEGPDEVVPFLRRVTAGRNIPDERLEVVGEHYYHFGGVSPINAINRALRDRLQAELGRRGIDLPVVCGNRNSPPFLGDVARELADGGHRHVLVLATSAYGGYSACRQYHEDIAHAVAASGGRLRMTRLPQTYHTDAFAEINADAVGRALTELGADSTDDSVRVVFTAHSVPARANAESGPKGDLYREQIEAVAAEVAQRAGLAGYDIAWQSRSGPPQVPWLEPDICDHLRELAARDVSDVVIAPIGFVSDHMEVIWDLDTEARGVADELGLRMARAATASDDPRFVTLYADLIAERAGRGGPVSCYRPPLQGALGEGSDGAPCAPGCCGAPT